MRGRSLVRLEAGAGSATRASAEPLRWEWRTFAKRGDPRLQSLVPAGAMSEPTRQETYIVSARSVNNVKVRDGFVEVKTLERRSDSGLELWRPALRGALPIAAAVVRRLCAAWHVPAPDLHLLSYGLGDLVQDVVAVEKDLAAIPVSKRRTRISPHGCQGEFVDLQIEGEAWWTVAIEGTDPNLVAGAVVKLGLAGLPTSSYPAALKSIACCFPAAGMR